MAIQKFRPKNLLVNAVQVNVNNLADIEALLGDEFKYETGKTVGKDEMTIDIVTPEGTYQALNNDWLVEEPDSTIKIYEDSVFHELYAPAQ